MNKDEAKIIGTESVLDVAANATADALKENGLNIFGEIIIDTVASALPGVGGAYVGYKNAKIKRNVEEIATALNRRMEEIQQIWHSKTVQQQQEIDKLFEHMLDSSLEESQQEKIEFFINGFLNISRCESINEDFVLLFYDLLKNLRLVDLTVLKLYGIRYLNNDVENIVSYRDVMEKHDITYEQYNLVRQNLINKGVLTVKTDLVIDKDLEEIEEAYKRLKKSVEMLKDGLDPKRKTYPKLKDLKLKHDERFEITKFGKEFIQFIINEI